MMQASVDPIDEEICKGDEEGELEEVVPETWPFGCSVVKFSITTNFGHEERDGKNSHDWKGDHSLANLKADLTFQELWMLECSLVENESV
jgi:hypothetical protein